MNGFCWKAMFFAVVVVAAAVPIPFLSHQAFSIFIFYKSHSINVVLSSKVPNFGKCCSSFYLCKDNFLLSDFQTNESIVFQISKGIL